MNRAAVASWERDRNRRESRSPGPGQRVMASAEHTDGRAHGRHRPCGLRGRQHHFFTTLPEVHLPRAPTGGEQEKRNARLRPSRRAQARPERTPARTSGGKPAAMVEWNSSSEGGLPTWPPQDGERDVRIDPRTRSSTAVRFLALVPGWGIITRDTERSCHRSVGSPQRAHPMPRVTEEAVFAEESRYVRPVRFD